MPIAFDCECGIRWWSPPQLGCPTCGTNGTSVPDPVIWRIGRVPGTKISITAQMRDAERFSALVQEGYEVFVDIAGTLRHVWRPREDETVSAGVNYVLIDGVEDLNVDLPDFAFDRVAEAVAHDRRALVFCAAGLKRSVHLVYGVLRSRGMAGEASWSAVEAARPFADRWEPYIAAAERWTRSAFGRG
jgi:hypothetical protein